jgi:3-deoxy-D-manno-octulosonate 8-phosphate phosphatase KdsC-like HAD superfamily phosphatase
MLYEISRSTPIVVNDAYPQVKKIAGIVLKKKGGEGAVRELCEIIAIAKNQSN